MNALKAASKKFGKSIRYWKHTNDVYETRVKRDWLQHNTIGDFDLLGFLREEGLRFTTSYQGSSKDSETLIFKFRLDYAPVAPARTKGSRVKVSTPTYPKLDGQAGVVESVHGDYTTIRLDNGIRDDFFHTEVWDECSTIFSV